MGKPIENLALAGDSTVVTCREWDSLPLAAPNQSNNQSMLSIRSLSAAVVAGVVIASSSAASWSSAAEVHEAGGRKPSWSDEFSGRAGLPPDPDRWNYDTGASGWGNGELQRYTARRKNSRLDGRGHLRIVARHIPGTGIRRGSFTSARLNTDETFSFRYGRVALRARLPKGRGLWPAFWMLGAAFPRVNWPFCGEIDVMENLGQNIRVSSGFVHGPGSLSDTGVGGFHRSTRSLAKGFHVFAADWTPTGVAFSVDGEIFRRVLKSGYPAGQTWAFDQRMFLLLNLAVGGSWPGKPSPKTRFPARYVIDWVRVWKA